MSTWLELEGDRVLVVGAGGLGSALVRGFAGAGARIVVLDAREDALQALDEELRLTEVGGGVVVADLSTADGCRNAMAQATEILGGLDVLVHAVAINDRRPVEDYGDEDWDKIVAINLSSAFWLAREAVPIMRDQGSGRIIFFSSVAGHLGHRHHGPYAATKGGVNQLMKVLAHELAPAGITVNAIAPGYIETELTTDYLNEGDHREQLVRLVPAGRLGTADEVVGFVLFLSSPHAGFITGQVLFVDGGRTLV